MSILLYWLLLIILLFISSYALYIVTLKYFQHTNIVFAITNFIIFGGIAYLFQPANIHITLLEEIGIIFIILLIQKTRK
jgi:hypothetical protein